LKEKETVAKEEPITTVPREVVSVPKPSRKKLYTGIITALLIGLAFGYVISSIPISGYRNQIANLQNQLQNQEQQYNTLSTNYEQLTQDYDSLRDEYNNLYAEYASLVEEYQGALKVPYTTIVGGNVTWVFRTLDGSIESWFMPIETYVYYVNMPKPTEYHNLMTDDGQLFIVRNMELFVQPEFFSEVISSLTDGNTAREFVREVFNLRVQLTLYSEDITDTPQWSAETMTRGAGDCEDFAILMGSLLVAGNEYADYGMAVQMVYMDADNPTSPQTVNHILLYIMYEDGTGEFVDSTSTYVLSPWSNVAGWYYDL